MNEITLRLPDQWQALRDSAQQARTNAWAPYSRFPVGAALLTNCGKIFAGCNVENASSGLTICAERTAVCAAVAQGHREFSAIWITLSGLPLPCGACRQFLSEFNPQLLLILDSADATKDSSPRLVLLSELFPQPFRLPSRPEQ